MRVALVIAAAMALAQAAGAVPTATVELRPELQVSTSLVRLGQLARIESTDLALVRRLVDLPVGRAPFAGDSILLERELLASWMRRLGVAAEQVTWEGPAATRIVSPSRTVPGEAFAAAARQGLEQWLAARSLRSELELVSVPRDLQAGPGDLQLRMRDPGHATLRPRMTVWIEAWVGGRFARVVPVTFGISASGGSPLALDASPLELPVAPPVSREGEAALTTDGRALPERAEAMPPGQPLAAGGARHAAGIAAAPAVRRGEWVSLRSGAGAVRTEARVQVLQDGRLGDSVRVRSSAATSSFLAKVAGSGELEVAQ